MKMVNKKAKKLLAITLTAILAVLSTAPGATAHARSLQEQERNTENQITPTEIEQTSAELTAVSGSGSDWYGENKESAARSIDLKYGEQIKLSVTATGGTRPLRYQWYKTEWNFTDGEFTDDELMAEYIIEGATDSDYLLVANTPGREYYCKVTDGTNQAGVLFYVNIDTELKAVSNTGTDYSGGEGSSSEREVAAKYQKETLLEVTASGLAKLNYAWYKEDEELTDVTGNSCMIYGSSDVTGEYRCAVSDGINTEVVFFYVTLDSGLIISPYDKYISVKYGKTTDLSVTATGGIGQISYQWYMDETPIAGATQNRCTLTGDENTGNIYTCKVSDEIASKDIIFYVTVDTEFQVKAENGTPYGSVPDWQRAYTVKSGETTNLSITASSLTGNLSYTWYQTNPAPTQELSCTTNSCSIKAGQRRAVYQCNVSDGIHAQILNFAVLPDINFNWNKTTETLTLRGTGCIPEGILTYSGCSAPNGEAMNSLKHLKIVIEDGIKELEDYALVIDRYNSSYSYDITIPASVTKIGKSAVGYEHNYYSLLPASYAKKSSDCTIHCSPNTTAQQYAEKNNIKYQLTEAGSSKTEIKTCSISINPQNAAYTGKSVKPKVTVKDGTKILTAGTDYTISYKNNTNIGTATITVTGMNLYNGSTAKNFSITAKKGSTHTSGTNKYKIENASEVSFTGLKNSKSAAASIPKTVKIGGKTFKVTSIAKNALKKSKVKTITIGENVKTIGDSAFEGCSQLTKATVGIGVTKIGANAFKNCKKLGSITIKSSKLKTMGKNTFKGIKPNAKIKVPAKKLKSYKKLFNGKGQGKKVKITK